MEKSYVTMAVCPICQKDTGEIILDRRLKPRFERRTVVPNPCDDCRKKYLKTATLIIAKDSGDIIVLKDSAFKRLFTKPIPKSKIVFTDKEVIDRILELDKEKK